jgi:large subunit ribosomal protein L25
MAKDRTLTAQRRAGDGKGEARKLRQNGQIPAVIYGGGSDPVAIALDSHETTLLLQSIPLNSAIINVALEGEKTPLSVKVQDIQAHPFKTEVLHMDLLRVGTAAPAKASKASKATKAKAAPAEPASAESAPADEAPVDAAPAEEVAAEEV